MCELFGLSSDQPVQPEELLCRFGARGGDTAAHSGAGSAVIATEPLAADPGWAAFALGELRVYCRGQRIARFFTHPHPAIATSSADSDRQSTGS